MAIGDDFSISAGGDIRSSAATNYTVIEVHRWLGDLMDDAQASGNDLLDITSATADERSTDNFITLNAPYNIDDETAKRIYDGSIVQDDGDTIYDGLVCYAPAGTPLYLLQGGLVVTPNFWTTTYNPNATAGISHRFMIKTRTGGVDIDGRRLVGLTRLLGSGYVEFKVAPTSRGNNTIALSPTPDLNNTTVEATIKTWTTITNSEGFRPIDVNNDGVDEGYYSEWNKATYTINQLYERAKYLSHASTAESTGSDTGNAFQLANATIQGQAQSFANGVQAQRLSRVFVNIRKVGSPTGNMTAVLYAHSGTFGTSSIPTGAALATSVNIDVSKLTTTYQTIEIGFDTQYEMVASTQYCIAFEHAVIDGSNYLEIEGSTAGTHGGNRSQDVSATWTPTAADDLNFSVYGSSDLYGLAGEAFRGITHEAIMDNPSGAFSAVEPISWSGGTGQLLAQKFISISAQTIDVVASAGTYTRSAGDYLTDGFTEGMTIVFSGFALGTNSSTRIIQSVTTTVITVTDNTGLADESGGGDEAVDMGAMWFQILTGVAPTDGQTITGGTSTETADVDTTVTERTLSFPYLGASTGTALIGAYGLGVEYLDLSANDKVFDLTNTQRTPPNNVTFTVLGLTTDDRVMVTAEDGAGGLDYDQLTLNTTLASGSTTVVVSATIPADTPASGTIRVLDDNGVYIRAPYTSWSGTTFNLTGTFGSDATAPKNVFVTYIDKDSTGTSEQFTTIYLSDRTLFIRVRDGKATPIKTADTTSVLSSTGGSVNTTRISDE